VKVYVLVLTTQMPTSFFVLVTPASFAYSIVDTDGAFVTISMVRSSPLEARRKTLKEFFKSFKARQDDGTVVQRFHTFPRSRYLRMIGVDNRFLLGGLA
jgi:hypothetical protein